MSILWTPRCGVGHHLRRRSLRVGVTHPSESRVWGTRRIGGCGWWEMGQGRWGPEATTSSKRRGGSQRRVDSWTQDLEDLGQGLQRWFRTPRRWKQTDKWLWRETYSRRRDAGGAGRKWAHDAGDAAPFSRPALPSTRSWCPPWILFATNTW